MANPVKYSTTLPSNALQKGNVAIGVNDISYGPTATTGWFSSTDPVSYYQIIETTVANVAPLTYLPNNSSELINFVRARGGIVSNEAQALNWISSQPNLYVSKVPYGNIVTDGLLINFDAGVASSYPTSGDNIYDLSGKSSNGYLINGPGFNGNSIVFDGIDDAIEVYNYPWTAKDTTICAFMNPAIDCPTGDNNIATIENTWEYKYNNLGNGTAYMQFASMPWAWYGNTSVRITLGQWQMLTFRHDSISTGLGSLWSNSTKIFQQSISGALASRTANIKLMGRYCCAGSPAKGDLGVILIYNRALSDAEINQNYQALRIRYGV